MADEVHEPTRDEIRSAIFSPKKAKSKTVTFFGTKIEIRQSTLMDIVSAAGEEDRKSAIAGALIRSAYVPGTDQKVFEEADTDSLLQLPFGGDFIKVNEAIQEMSEVNFLDKGGDSPKTPVST